MANRKKQCDTSNEGGGDLDCSLEAVLDQLKCQFAEMVPVRRMRWQNHIPDGIDIQEAIQKRVLNATVDNPVSVKYPASLTYRRSFMKQFIHMLEKSGCEICDEVYEIYTDLLEQVEEEDDTLCYKTYYLPNEPVSLQESVNMISRGSTGLNTWQAAQHLAEWCCENKDVFHNRKVLELGSGLGLTGLTVCKECKPLSYSFTDCHSQVLFLLAKNIERNLSIGRPKRVDDGSPTHVKDATMMKRIRRQLSLNAESMANELGCLVMSGNDDEISEVNSDSGDFELSSTYWNREEGGDAAALKSHSWVNILRLNWEHVPSSLIVKLQPDVVLAADVVYDIHVIPFIVSALAKIFRHSSCVAAYVACTIRNDETRDQFLYALGTVDLKFEQILSPLTKYLHYDRSIPIEIIRIHP